MNSYGITNYLRYIQIASVRFSLRATEQQMAYVWILTNVGCCFVKILKVLYQVLACIYALNTMERTLY